MGVAEDIEWLNDDEEGLRKVFLFIAGKAGVTLRGLKELYGSKDWWPVKSYVRALVDRGLVVERETDYVLTEHGKKVREGFRAIEYVQELI